MNTYEYWLYQNDAYTNFDGEFESKDALLKEIPLARHISIIT
jgi:hypothetical protein